MALDGAVLHQITHEINTLQNKGRVSRIVQPGRDELIIHFRVPGEERKLLISSNASNARVHFIEDSPENPDQPPMFCMLLRKHLQSARLKVAEQQGMDRVLHLKFDARDELGDETVLTLVVEIMGRHSNIILVNQQGIIIDALKKVDFELSSVRQVLPRLPYQSPPSQDKLNIIKASTSTIIESVKTHENLQKGLLSSLEGFSPLPTRELAYLATNQVDTDVASVTDEQWAVLETNLNILRDNLGSYWTNPTLIKEKDGKPRDFSFMNITQYQGLLDTQEFANYSLMLEFFYAKKAVIERTRQKSGNLLRILDNTIQRISRRLDAQKQELLASADRDDLRIKGDILTANLHQLERGKSQVILDNFYDPDGGKIEIKLDPQLTPVENSQEYYSRYRKADVAEKMLTQQIKTGKDELAYVESLLDHLKRGETEADIEAVRIELIEAGYIKQRRKGKPSKTHKQKPHLYTSTDGFRIYAGRNNKQNDQLTLKDSRPEDIWFHTKDIPGSHVVIETQGKEVPPSTIEEAAIVAAYHSKGRDSTKIAVDYAEIRHVKKPSGAKPGMVIYNEFSSIIVDPQEKIINQLMGKQPKQSQ